MVDLSNIQEQKPTCTCGKDLTKEKGYYACDEMMQEYCEVCWPNTSCAKGEHGEGCPTVIFNG